MEREKDLSQQKTFLNFLSHYLWLIFIGFIFLIILCIKSYQEVPEIKSYSSSKQWNSSYNPHILGFISDSHIATYNHFSISDTEKILSIYNETNAEKVLFAGDICDNFGSNTLIKHGRQYPNDFEIFNKITQKYPKDYIIIASGNHDEFGVDSYNSSNHLILQYADFYKKNPIYRNYDNFLISKVKLDDIEIFIMNPYQYPTVSAGLGYYMNLTREMVDKIEAALTAPSNSTSRILLTHFPLSYSMIDVKSSITKKTLTDIVTSSNITAVLAGHSHFELVIHRKTTLEIHSFAVKREAAKGSGYRYITIDNGGLNDHSYNLKGEKPVAILTYPIPKKYISDQTDFSIENFNQAEVRVVHFSENPNLKISVTFSCKSNGYQSKPTLLEYQRIIRSNQSLYSIPLKKLYTEKINGFLGFRLTFSGDFSHSAEFVVSNSAKLDREILDTDVSFHKSIIIIGIVCWIIIFFVWCPFPPLICFNNLSNWIAGKSDSNFNKSFGNRIVGTIGVTFGFFVMKSQIYQNIPKWIQFVIFFLVLSPLFIPICLLQSGNSYGFIYFIGYYLKSFAFDYWPVTLTSYFILFVLLPSTIVFSEIAYFIQTKSCSYSFLVDICLILLQIMMIAIVAETSLYQTTSLVFTFCSPLFVIEPIIILIMETFAFSKYSKQSNVKECKIQDECDKDENCTDEKIEI